MAMASYESICREVYLVLEQSPDINPDNYDTEQVINLNWAVIKALAILEEVVTL